MSKSPTEPMEPAVPTEPTEPAEPRDLIASPRGRRLCLEFAQAYSYASDPYDEDGVRQVLMNAAYALDPGRGTSVVRFGLGATASPDPTPDDAAHALDSLAQPEANPEALFQALAAAVDNARYWQEPDGEDVLAATPQLRKSLSRFASGILASPNTLWWDAPLDSSTQCSVSFDSRAADDPAKPRPAKPSPEVDLRAALATWRKESLADEATAQHDRPKDPTAMWSGSWWSRPPHALPRTTRSLPGFGAVGLHLVEDRGDAGTAWVQRLAIPSEARILEITGPQDWARLCRESPLEMTASRRHDWYRTTGRDGRWVLPDWERVAIKFDAVHLTVAGYLATSGISIDVEPGIASVLAGWDPDATFWFRNLQPINEQPQQWRINAETDSWEPVSPKQDPTD